MSVLLTAPAPVPGPYARTEAPPPPAAATRPAPAVRAETARAPQPPESAGRGLDIRFEDSRGRPVGPPPAFQVTLLAAMRECALRPPVDLADGAVRFAAPALVDRKI